mmetsp:Transcript_63624/g.125889  ORF Transcript_63624/g.125889 Transcript_63624/m.125889 type:complete len:89 (+) Transcript_63624:35-301(+)
MPINKTHRKTQAGGMWKHDGAYAVMKKVPARWGICRNQKFPQDPKICFFAGGIAVQGTQSILLQFMYSATAMTCGRAASAATPMKHLQ